MIDFKEPSKVGKKGGKRGDDAKNLNMNELKIPSLQFELYSNSETCENTPWLTLSKNRFTLSGKLHLNVVVPQSFSMKQLIAVLEKDIHNSTKARIEMMHEEALTNEAMVNPMNLNSDNLTRIDGFNLTLPRKTLIRLNSANTAEPKSKF